MPPPLGKLMLYQLGYSRDRWYRVSCPAWSSDLVAAHWAAVSLSPGRFRFPPWAPDSGGGPTLAPHAVYC